MTDPDHGPDADTSGEDPRSDIEQAVDSRRDALDRGEGGDAPAGVGGESGAGGVVKNQEGNDQ